MPSVNLGEGRLLALFVDIFWRMGYLCDFLKNPPYVICKAVFLQGICCLMLILLVMVRRVLTRL